jgi:hypothetical protein
VFFSAKHKLYGFKVEVSVSPRGLAVWNTNHYPGSASDLTIMVQNREVHLKNLQKTEQELLLPDHGEGSESHPRHWAVLVDKGINNLIQVIKEHLLNFELFNLRKNPREEI